MFWLIHSLTLMEIVRQLQQYLRVSFDLSFATMQIYNFKYIIIVKQHFKLYLKIEQTYCYSKDEMGHRLSVLRLYLELKTKDVVVKLISY